MDDTIKRFEQEIATAGLVSSYNAAEAEHLEFKKLVWRLLYTSHLHALHDSNYDYGEAMMDELGWHCDCNYGGIDGV